MGSWDSTGDAVENDGTLKAVAMDVSGVRSIRSVLLEAIPPNLAPYSDGVVSGNNVRFQWFHWRSILVGILALFGSERGVAA